MEEKLVTMLSGLFKMKAEDIQDAMTMKDIEVWDSLKHMEMIVSIEQTFATELTFEEIVAMTSIGEIKRILREKGI